MEKRLQQTEDDLKLVTKELEKERSKHKELSDQVNNDIVFEFSWTICCLVILVLILLHVVILNNFKLQMVKVATKYKADEKVKRITKQYLPTAREGNVFTGVCLSATGCIAGVNFVTYVCYLTATGSLLGLLTARSVRILLECFLG